MNYVTTQTFTENVIVYPFELNDTKKNILTKLKHHLSTCSEEYGYILDVDNVNWATMTNKISRISGNCIFNVTYEAKTFKPVVGHEYRAEIVVVVKEGIFCEYNNIQILIPADILLGWRFVAHVYMNIATLEEIKAGDFVNVLICMVRYGSHKYQCVGNMI